MRSIALGFAGGAWWLQRASSLPEAATMGWLIAACVALMLACRSVDVFYASRPSRCTARPHPPAAVVAGVRCGLVVVAAALAGFDWAAWRAHQHTRTAWPTAWEGRDVVLTGRIESMPVRAAAQAAWPGALVRGRPGMQDWLMTLQVLRASPSGNRSPRPVGGDEDGTGGGKLVRFRDFHAQKDPGGVHDGFTGRVQLRLRDIGATSAGAPQAGDVWRMVARLQRPHGLANFGLPMREASLFQRGIRATGSARAGVRLRSGTASMPDVEPYVKRQDRVDPRLSLSGQYVLAITNTSGHRLHVDADVDADARWAIWRLRASVERLRSRIGARIDTVLAEAPHRGVVVALALGLQAAISPDDWTRFTRTGTNHLVAVSGLHIGLAAAVAAWCTRQLLRVIGARGWSRGAPPIVRIVRIGRIGRTGVARRFRAWRVPPLLLIVPRQYIVGGVAIVAAGAFVALSGFGVPAQRAFWMLSAYCLTSIDGRRVSPTVIWSLALWFVVLVDPWAVQSAGGWLSFTAIGAILYIASTIPRPVRPPRVNDYGNVRTVTGDTAALLRTARFTMAVRPGEWRPLADGDANARLPVSVPIPLTAAPLLRQMHAGPAARDALSPRSLTFRCYRALVSNSVASIAGRVAGLKRCFAVAIGFQVALSLALAPASLVWFGETSLVGPLANLVAIPWVSFVTVPAVFCGLVLPAPLDASAWRLAHGAIAWLHRGLGALIDGASFASAHLGIADRIRVPAPSLLVLASACVGIALLLMPRTSYTPGLSHWGRQCLAAVLCMPIFCYRPAAPALGDFRVTMLDIGQGNGVLVETRGHRLLYDTGPPYGHDDNAGRRVIVPYLRRQGIAALDGVIISHPHDDHYGGAFAVIDALPVRHLVASWPVEEGGDVTVGTQTVSRRDANAAALPPLWRHAGARGIVRRRCRAGDAWQWDGVGFETLWPSDPAMRAPPNHTSCVLRITNGRHTILLTGDIESPQEAALLQAGSDVRADVLLAPHHGSATSSTPAFIDAVSPRHVVFQAGFRNRHRHPNARVMTRYAARGIQQYRSDADGAVRFIARGPTLHVETVRRDQRRYWMTPLSDTFPRAAPRSRHGSNAVSRADRQRTEKQHAADTRDHQR